MNDTFQNIMLFINEHTLLLIGICVFLILVLIGYLIDNSVKSKRVRNDIKNADQVPKNIKDEIIKEASETQKFKDVAMEEKIKKEEETKEILEGLKPTENTDIIMDNNVDTSLTDNSQIDLNSSLNLDNTNEVNNNIQDINVDPDINIMSQPSEYKNDKRLSEILSEINKVNYQNSIFDKEQENITINNEVKNDDVQIQRNSSDDELDRIMKKLSSMNSQEEDNYTNIF